MNDANDSPDMADTADKSDRWTVRGIGADTRRKAADMAAKADIPLGRWLSRLIEQAADMADMADVPADVFAGIVARLERLERVVFVADRSDAADINSSEPLCPTRSPVPAPAASSAPVGTPTASMGVPGGAGAGRKRLAGDAKAERATDIKRRLAAGERKPEIMAALGISLATLNRALAK